MQYIFHFIMEFQNSYNRIRLNNPNPHSVEVYALCENDGQTGVLIYPVVLITEISLS